ncbi:hypothetical protein [Mycobacteroides chelonae]|uniref:hypothetical protein n=1 Tax=Mycobacteroides chelonae TaxID=1774 RepID=UPI00099483E7|nr:hypothetical protein [Mycobacteroides chelonae]
MGVNAEYIVIMPRIEGNPQIGYTTAYYSDMKRCQTLRGVIRHGSVDLDQSDDFLIGKVEGNRLVRLQWMDELRDDKDELAQAAEGLGLSI